MFANEIDKCFNIVSKCVCMYQVKKEDKNRKKKTKNRKKEEKTKKKREKEKHRETLPMSMPVALALLLTALLPLCPRFIRCNRITIFKTLCDSKPSIRKDFARAESSFVVRFGIASGHCRGTTIQCRSASRTFHPPSK